MYPIACGIPALAPPLSDGKCVIDVGIGWLNGWLEKIDSNVTQKQVTDQIWRSRGLRGSFPGLPVSLFFCTFLSLDFFDVSVPSCPQQPPKLSKGVPKEYPWEITFVVLEVQLEM